MELSARELKAELTRLGLDFTGCLEKRDLLEKLHQSGAAVPRCHPQAARWPDGAPMVVGPSSALCTPATLHVGVLLAALKTTLALQGTEVQYVDMQRRGAQAPLAIEDAARLLMLEDARTPLALTDAERDLYLQSRCSAYEASASNGTACLVLALPSSQRVGSDASTPLLAYRRGPILALPPQPSLNELRAGYRGHKLFERLDLDVNIFDTRWDYDFARPRFTDPGFADQPQTRGGLPYRRPLGWRRFGLRVQDRFVDPDWLSSDGRAGEWAVAYHGTCAHAVRPIATSGLQAGGRGGVERLHGAIFGDGVYCAPHVEHAAFFAEAVPVEAAEGLRCFQVVFQCRLRPSSFTVHDDGLGDVFVVKSEANIRPYGILLSECLPDGTPTLACREWP